MAFSITIGLHGSKAGFGGGNKAPAKRGVIQGWSQAATRRNVDFLRSVDHALVFEVYTGLAFTGTVALCPGSSTDWSVLRDRFLTACVSRLGSRLVHWVTEWQRRGVPHLHGVMYFDAPAPDLPHRIISLWLDLAAEYSPEYSGQHVSPIFDGLGWAQYTAKHAARGVSHYQRAKSSQPAGWQSGTGRVWGKRGKWPVRPPMRFESDPGTFYRYRRLCRSWRLADARSSGSVRRIVSARKSLKCSCPYKSSVRGVSEWLPIDLSSSMLVFASSHTPHSTVNQVS